MLEKKTHTHIHARKNKTKQNIIIVYLLKKFKIQRNSQVQMILMIFPLNIKGRNYTTLPQTFPRIKKEKFFLWDHSNLNFKYVMDIIKKDNYALLSKFSYNNFNINISK